MVVLAIVRQVKPYDSSTKSSGGDMVWELFWRKLEANVAVLMGSLTVFRTLFSQQGLKSVDASGRLPPYGTPGSHNNYYHMGDVKSAASPGGGVGHRQSSNRASLGRRLFGLGLGSKEQDAPGSDIESCQAGPGKIRTSTLTSMIPFTGRGNKHKNQMSDQNDTIHVLTQISQKDASVEEHNTQTSWIASPEPTVHSYVSH
jgi:hypothetical protein